MLVILTIALFGVPLVDILNDAQTWNEWFNGAFLFALYVAVPAWVYWSLGRSMQRADISSFCNMGCPAHPSMRCSKHLLHDHPEMGDDRDPLHVDARYGMAWEFDTAGAAPEPAEFRRALVANLERLPEMQQILVEQLEEFDAAHPDVATATEQPGAPPNPRER